MAHPHRTVICTNSGGQITAATHQADRRSASHPVRQPLNPSTHPKSDRSWPAPSVFKQRASSPDLQWPAIRTGGANLCKFDQHQTTGRNLGKPKSQQGIGGPPDQQPHLSAQTAST
ncbi:hypothetical protein ACLOJK_041624 [Asimina triloba]